MEISNRFVQKLANGSTVVVDNATRNAYSDNVSAMRAPVYFMYKKNTVEHLEEVYSDEFLADLPENIPMISAIEDEKDSYIVDDKYKIIVCVGESRATVIANFPSGYNLNGIKDIAAHILSTKSEIIKNPLPITIIHNSVPVVEDEPVVAENETVTDVVVEETVEVKQDETQDHKIDFIIEESSTGRLHVKPIDLIVSDFIGERGEFQSYVEGIIHFADFEETIGTSENHYSKGAIIEREIGSYLILNPWDTEVYVFMTPKGYGYDDLAAMAVNRLKETDSKFTKVYFISVKEEVLQSINSIAARLSPDNDYWVNEVSKIRWLKELFIEEVASDKTLKLLYNGKRYDNPILERGISLQHVSKSGLSTKSEILTSSGYTYSNFEIQDEREIKFSTIVDDMEDEVLIILPTGGVDSELVNDITIHTLANNSVKPNTTFYMVSVDNATELFADIVEKLSPSQEGTEMKNNHIVSTDWKFAIGATPVRFSILPKDTDYSAYFISQPKTLDDVNHYWSAHYLQTKGVVNNAMSFGDIEHINTGKQIELAITTIQGNVEEDVPSVVVAMPLVRFDARDQAVLEGLEADELLVMLEAYELIDSNFYRHEDKFVKPAVIFCEFFDTKWANLFKQTNELDIENTWTVVFEKFHDRKFDIFNVAGAAEVAVETVEEEVVEAAVETVEEAVEVAIEEPVAVVEERGLTETHNPVDESPFHPTEEVSEVIGEVKETAVKSAPYIKVELSDYLLNFTPVAVESNVTILSSDNPVDDEHRCVGVIIDFNDYLVAIDLLKKYQEKGVAVYQLRYLNGGTDHDIVRIA